MDDQVKLLAHSKTRIVESNYLSQLAAGNRNDWIKKQRNYYMDYQERHIPVSHKNKDNQILFGELPAEMEYCIKEEKLSYKKETDLIQMVQKFNLLVSGNDQ